MKGIPEAYTKAHEYSVLVGNNKIIVFDFELLNNENKLYCLEINGNYYPGRYLKFTIINFHYNFLLSYFIIFSRQKIFY